MEVFGQMLAAAGVILLLVGTLWWLRRRGVAGMLQPKGKRGRRLESLERLCLGPQHALHLVRFDETALLIASSPAGCTLVQSSPCWEGKRQQEAIR